MNTEHRQTLLRLARKRKLTADITEFTFEAVDGGQLPAFEPGAHLTVQCPTGLWRSYSLCGDEQDAFRYVIAVKKEERGRGGSRSMHDDTTLGQSMAFRPPKNTLGLVPAARYLLVAGGIGITPMFSLLRALVRRGADVELIYVSPFPETAAYLQELSSEPFKSFVTIHHSYRDPDRSFDLWPFLATPTDRHLYFCGPPRMLDGIYLQTVHWPRSMVHYEDFVGVDALGSGATAFALKRAGTSEIFDVPADKTILDVLRAHRISFESSCESGTCGTCKMAWSSGLPEHRDVYLSEADRSQFFMPCVSRAVGEICLEF